MFILNKKLCLIKNKNISTKRNYDMNEKKGKENLKFILSKTLLFIFCVLFIKVYSTLFGSENSIVGVVLLMALLMFTQSDFGYNTKLASISIPIMFVVIGIFAKLSNINPFLGLIIHLLVLSFIVFIGRGDKNATNYLAYAMGYIMFKGYNVGGYGYSKRLISLAVIGAIIALIYYLKYNKKTFDKSLKERYLIFDNEKSFKRWNLMFVLIVSIAMFIGDLLKIEKNIWINLTVLSLLPPIEENLIERKSARVPATFIGCIIFLALFGYIIPEESQAIFILIGGWLSFFITDYFLKTIYNSFSALGTATIMIPMGKAIWLRLTNNLIGFIIVIISITIFKEIFERIDKREIS